MRSASCHVFGEFSAGPYESTNFILSSGVIVCALRALSCVVLNAYIRAKKSESVAYSASRSWYDAIL